MPTETSSVIDKESSLGLWAKLCLQQTEPLPLALVVHKPLV